jgi:hypothetical protein
MILIPVKSDARKKEWHFRHYVDSNCQGGKETALHRYAVQILLDHSEIILTKHLSISYTNPRKEVSIFENRSDATVTNDDSDVHFEVFVTHDLDLEKISMYQTNKVKCIKIDLSDKSFLRADPATIKDAVLRNAKNKTFIYWQESPIINLPLSSQSEKSTTPTLTIWDIIIAIALFFGARYLWNQLRTLFRRNR